MDRESGDSGQSYAQTVSYAGGGHGELSVSVSGLLADEVEGVDIRSSAQQALVEDDNEHQPDAGQELETHCEQEQHRIHHLKHRESPQIPDLHTAQRRPRHQHTNLVQCLVPAILLCMGQGEFGEIQELHQALVDEVLSEVDQSQGEHEPQQAFDDMKFLCEGEWSGGPVLCWC